VLLGAPALAQHREYYVRGKVVDSDKKPLQDVEIRLRDAATSRSYDIRTDKEGAFKFAGLPHGVYAVTFTLDGYAPKTDEWKLDAPQDRMQRVDIPDVVLVSQARVQEIEGLKERGRGQGRRGRTPWRPRPPPRSRACSRSGPTTSTRSFCSVSATRASRCVGRRSAR
jgi:hypothetical protein